ncbi:unnamed protein product [Dovyalis caffra]|uniref:Aminotransferase class I/classII large domain-containing protein n=1 Tax=Dovyalis caffra TaxID=77055 RepID=A0AAV1QM35_9ROSI|nr:unnamed protein product [Dovyalis caffra]
MENGSKKWGFQANKSLSTSSAITVRGVLNLLLDKLNKEDRRQVIPLAHGDPSAFPCFRTTPVADEAVADAVRSAKYNHYAPTVGLLPARRVGPSKDFIVTETRGPHIWDPLTRLETFKIVVDNACKKKARKVFIRVFLRKSVADYLNRDLPYKLSPDDVFLTIGCTQAIEITLTVLARPGANILLPRPGFPYYEARATHSHLEVRHFDLFPEKGWEVDLEAVEALADENTVAMVVINPGNPCGSVYSFQHLQKIAETARKLGIMVIADEVYGHLTFGSTPFVPMGVFGSIVPVLTLGSISKRWIVPGWRIGWLVTSDPHGILQDSGELAGHDGSKTFVVESIKACLDISSDPATFTQGAIPQIIENTPKDFFSKINNILREAADICYEKIQDIPCITLPHKPEGSMFVMVKLNLSLLEGIDDDMEFCQKLVQEESVMILPGITVGMKNYLRITFAIEPSALEVGLERLKAFYERHAKKQ